MKEIKGKNNNIPWCVRYCEWVEKVLFGKPLKIILILTFILASVISYGILKNKSVTSYEELYDIEFKNYINTKLEEISNIVIDEGIGIKVEQIPQTVIEYDISWREEGVEFGYVLNTEKIISEYFLETEKTPTSSYLEEEFRMDVQMSKDFKNINKKSSIEFPAMTKEEYQKEYPKRIVKEALLNGAMAVFMIIVASIPILFVSIFPAFASEKWIEKHEDEYNKYFHKETTK